MVFVTVSLIPPCENCIELVTVIVTVSPVVAVCGSIDSTIPVAPDVPPVTVLPAWKAGAPPGIVEPPMIPVSWPFPE